MKFLFAALLLSATAFADGSDLGFHFRGNADYVHPRASESAFEIGVAGLVYPIVAKDFVAGPRASFLTASQNGQSRSSWYLGAEENLWFFNVFGPGLGLDWVASSGIDRDHYRIEPLFDLRLLHLGEAGALALRFAVPYEQGLQWGFKFGVTLQLNGLR
jgi:hypothetical protein